MGCFFSTFSEHAWIYVALCCASGADATPSTRRQSACHRPKSHPKSRWSAIQLARAALESYQLLPARHQLQAAPESPLVPAQPPRHAAAGVPQPAKVALEPPPAPAAPPAAVAAAPKTPAVAPKSRAAAAPSANTSAVAVPEAAASSSTPRPPTEASAQKAAAVAAVVPEATAPAISTPKAPAAPKAAPAAATPKKSAVAVPKATPAPGSQGPAACARVTFRRRDQPMVQLGCEGMPMYVGIPRECLLDPFAELRVWGNGGGKLWPFCTRCGCWSDSAHVSGKKHVQRLKHHDYV